MLAFLAVAPSAHAQPWLERSASLVIDADTGSVLHADQAGELRHPASLTKMMTLYLTFEAIEAGRLQPNDALVVSANAASQPPSRLGLTPGSRIQARQAVLGLITKSANDAAVVLAEALGGSEENFARSMTQRARSFGMQDTVFQNASGLPDREQVTTARDLAILALRLLRDFPQEYVLFSTETFAFRGRVHGNHNRLLHSYEGTDGIKTGYIRDSGFNLVASVRREGRRLIGVVLGGESGSERDQRMMELLDQGFARIGVSEIRTARAPEPQGGLRLPSLVGSAQAATNADGPGGRNLGVGDRTEPRSRGPRNWRVQLGAFASSAAAQREAQAGSARFGGSPDVDPVRSRGKVLHRASLQGMTAAEAYAACAERARRRLDCTASGPAGLAQPTAARALAPPNVRVATTGAQGRAAAPAPTRRTAQRGQPSRRPAVVTPAAQRSPMLDPIANRGQPASAKAKVQR